MNRAALFFDIDGTVLSEITKEIPASTVDALKRAHDAGHFLFINTGRTYCSVPVELKKLPFDGYFLHLMKKLFLKSIWIRRGAMRSLII